MTEQLHTHVITFTAEDYVVFRDEMESRKGSLLEEGESCEVGNHVAAAMRELQQLREAREATSLFPDVSSAAAAGLMLYRRLEVVN